MRRSILASILFLPSLALAQNNVVIVPEPEVPPPPKEQVTVTPTPDNANPPAPGATPSPSVTPAPDATIPQQPPQYTSKVVGYKPSPKLTQDRNFSTTRFWLLDPGAFEVEVWYDGRFDKSFNQEDQLFQAEIMFGLVPHIQIDIYHNFVITDGTADNGTANRQFNYEGTQVEARIAFPSYYGQIPLNPVLYVEWHPRHNNPDRGELRLLLGGMANDWLFLAANPYVEGNLESSLCYQTRPAGELGTGSPNCDTTSLTAGTQVLGRSTQMIYDAEAGTTLAAGFKVNDYFNLSLQAKIGFDMLGGSDNKWNFVAWAGPGFMLKPFGDKRLKITGTFLFNIAGPDTPDLTTGRGVPQIFEPVLIAGTQW